MRLISSVSFSFAALPVRFSTSKIHYTFCVRNDETRNWKENNG
jgi:hypothetical protein